jgi:hypothetical protein
MSLAHLLSADVPPPTVPREEMGALIVLDGVLTADECAALLDAAAGLSFDDAPITTLLGPVLDRSVRTNTRAMVDDVELARVLWGRIGERTPPVPFAARDWRACGLNERFRWYRYDPGQAFRWHRDGAHRATTGERSFFSVLLYLNGGFGGGQTEFADAVPVVPAAGRVLLFDHRLVHQGAPVVSGRKWVLRTDVMYRR